MTVPFLGALAFLGWLACVAIYVSYRGRNLADEDDDREQLDKWIDDLRAEPVFSSDPGQFYNQDEDRPMPYPKLRSVP